MLINWAQMKIVVNGVIEFEGMNHIGATYNICKERKDKGENVELYYKWNSDKYIKMELN